MTAMRTDSRFAVDQLGTTSAAHFHTRNASVNTRCAKKNLIDIRRDTYYWLRVAYPGAIFARLVRDPRKRTDCVLELWRLVVRTRIVFGCLPKYDKVISLNNTRRHEYFRRRVRPIRNETALLM